MLADEADIRLGEKNGSLFSRGQRQLEGKGIDDLSKLAGIFGPYDHQRFSELLRSAITSRESKASMLALKEFLSPLLLELSQKGALTRAGKIDASKILGPRHMLINKDMTVFESAARGIKLLNTVASYLSQDINEYYRPTNVLENRSNVAQVL